MLGKRTSIKLSFLLQTILCWYCLIKAYLLPYRDSYGLIIFAILISFLFVGLLRALYVWRRGWLEEKKWWLIVWIFTGSPLPLAVGLLFYSEFFGPLNT